MGYRLESAEAPGEGVLRAAREELLAAAGRLAAGGEDSVYEARKSIKKARAALRLMEAEIPGAAVERRKLAATGRKLSELRDADAIALTLDQLVGSHPECVSPDRLPQLKTALTAHARSNGVDPARAGRALEASAKRVTALKGGKGGFEAIAPGFERTLRRSRNAYRTAAGDPSDENLHEWRKLIKEHWNHARLLEDIWPELMRAYAQSVKQPEALLGNHHNLVVLSTAMTAAARSTRLRAVIRRIEPLAAERRGELCAQALQLGARLYCLRPRRLTSALVKLWENWSSTAAGSSLDDKAALPFDTHATE